jgi:hypothetical protein
MSQRRPFSTVSCFRRFVSRDKSSHYGDEKMNYEKLQFEREIIDVVRSSYI